jgi:hypothetical protein
MRRAIFFTLPVLFFSISFVSGQSYFGPAEAKNPENHTAVPAKIFGAKDSASAFLIALRFGFGHFSSEVVEPEDESGAIPYVTIGVGASYLVNHNLFTFRFSEISDEYDDCDVSNPCFDIEDEMWELGLLYGRATRGKAGMASLSSGISLAVNDLEGIDPSFPLNDPGKYRDVKRKTAKVGLPLEGQLLWNASGFMDLGLTGLANINASKTFYALLLTAQFDLFRLGKHPVPEEVFR